MHKFLQAEGAWLEQISKIKRNIYSHIRNVTEGIRALKLFSASAHSCLGDPIVFLSSHTDMVLSCPGEVAEAQSGLLQRCPPPLGGDVPASCSDLLVSGCTCVTLLITLPVRSAPTITARPRKMGRSLWLGNQIPSLPSSSRQEEWLQSHTPASCCSKC